MDVQPRLRSQVSSVQLISLVLSRHWKKYGNVKCNSKFIEDMQYLEDHGMEITKPTTMTVKVGLAYIIGDNLGAHTVSEMSQSFSSGFVCRWCKITYDDIHNKRFCYKECSSDFNVTKWTVEDYDNLADTAESSGLPQQGIKRHSAFNSLKSFHCVGQLPPCCGHDFFEGVFAYDIQFYLDYIVNKEKLMTAECLNEKITLAILSERDASNRPKPFKTRKHGSKYEGNANSGNFTERDSLVTHPPIKSVRNSNIVTPI